MPCQVYPEPPPQESSAYQTLAERHHQAEHQNREAREALRDFVNTYANIEAQSHDVMEALLFRAWLKAVDVLGIKPRPPVTRVGGGRSRERR